MSEEAEILKNVAPHSLAIAFPIRVFPVPGGPKSNIPGWRNDKNKVDSSISSMLG